ncbi:hypothetical protein H8E07_14240 [bacterium]|nr:hypothetical protein [bacterium]
MTSRLTKTPVAALLFVAAIMCAPSAPALASVITAFGGASGPGLASMSFNNLGTPAAGNDDVVGASPNWIHINQKAFGAVDYIDMVFIVEDFGVPSTEYVLSEGVDNGTGTDWIGYQVVLGFGTGAGFTPSTLGDGLGFDNPDFNSPLDFTPFEMQLPLNEDVHNAVLDVFANGAFHVFTFTIDVPNTISEFTIRQAPRTLPVADELVTWSDVKGLYR